MITHIQLPEYIAENMPELNSILRKATVAQTPGVYAYAQCLVDFTKTMVQQHNYGMLRRCFKLAAQLYNHGNIAVKEAMENVYVFSFSTLLSNCETYRERNLVQAAMPGSLYKVYVKQLASTGI